MIEDHPQTLDERSVPAGAEIVTVAEAAAEHADRDHRVGELVIVARTTDGTHRAVGGRLGPLRAAVSVAVAAQNSRLWSGSTGTETILRPVASMPEVVRAAAEAGNVTSAYVGCIEDESLAAVAVWFEIDGCVADANDRRMTMELLSAAAARQREFFASQAATPATSTAPNDVSAEVAGRQFDPDDPSIDSVTGLATAADFEAAVEDYDSDEATLVVVDLDGFNEVVSQHGQPAADAVLREIADRLVSSCRQDDLIARIGPDTFAVLFADATRSVGLHVAKRLLDTIALPLSVAGGPEAVTATVALAHQFGLVDMEELVESADDAVASGKRAGTGRLVIAS